MTKGIQISEINVKSEIPVFPKSISWFPVSYLQYWVKESLEIGGKAFVGKESDLAKDIQGLLIYDPYEGDGTIFTQSRAFFDEFYKLEPFATCFSELQTEHSHSAYNIISFDADKIPAEHKFKHPVSIETNIVEIEKFMQQTHEGLNPKWVRVALENGDRCFVAKIGDNIIGMSWLSLVDGVARATDLYTKPEWRKDGVGRDLFYARLLYMKAAQVRKGFSEVAEENIANLTNAFHRGYTISARMYEYYDKGAVHDGRVV